MFAAGRGRGALSEALRALTRDCEHVARDLMISVPARVVIATVHRARRARVREDGFARIITIAAPSELLRCVVHKGSITVEGVSLTVARIDDGGFDVSLIPQTLERTNSVPPGPGAA